MCAIVYVKKMVPLRMNLIQIEEGITVPNIGVQLCACAVNLSYYELSLL